jgi:8-oxo-dGTP pyrophosphatase MutT (NUDIX family)
MIARVRKGVKSTKGKERLVGVLAISTKKPDEILLVTSRHSRSWALAKGRVEPSLGPVESARKEAFEEAGVAGRMTNAPIGSFIHHKSTGGKFRVQVFKMHVQKELSTWPERKQRQRRWVPVKSALKLVSNPGLRRLIRAQFGDSG